MNIKTECGKITTYESKFLRKDEFKLLRRMNCSYVANYRQNRSRIIQKQNIEYNGIEMFMHHAVVLPGIIKRKSMYLYLEVHHLPCCQYSLCIFILMSTNYYSSRLVLNPCGGGISISIWVTYLIWVANDLYR